MTASVLFSISTMFGIWGVFSYLDYRLNKQKWKGKTRTDFEHTQNRKSFIVIWGERFDQTDYGKKLELRLRRVNIILTPSEFCSMLFVGGLGLTLIFNMLLKFNLSMSFIFAVIAIAAITQLIFLIRRNKYQEKLNNQLSEVCVTLANATRSGMTLSQGFQLVARELSEPSRSEFKQLSNELSLGQNFEDALLKFQQKIKGRDYKLFIVSLLTQKKAGGNLHETLEEMAKVLDERKFLEQEIKTLTSEQKFISYVIPSIPIILIFAINMMMEEFTKVLFTIPGIIILAMFAIGILLSFILVQKVTKIRV
ncbi:tight adherence protein B [Gracilibacillus ureilyticus]|uniref:Tight adherence protein B n=1 Tax=Gracilibacillus ureilyticus TaxID=531814 RepID=A0A1H9VJ63_9BACI|nr:type II secretion system F family protein [Gracilibacillus ureilyticus]SES21599.1 tight adherence protein B [Gracilibacillus ureilyticus]